jgi:4-amino-4-deoxy-L-arabinose transferase-like glycosyltransferase
MLLPGLIAMTLPFVPWMVYIADTFPQAAHIFSRQTVERGMGTRGLPESAAPAMMGYYLVSLAKWALPWIAFLPGAAIIPLMKRFQKDRQGLVFLFLWVYGLLLLFSASMDRHEQYILPALPAACLLMGYCAEEVFFGHRWISAKLAAFIVNGHAVALTFCLPAAAVAVALAPHDTRPKVVHILVIAGLAAPMLWLAVLAMRAGRLNAVLACLVVASAVGNLGFNTRLDLWNDKWNDLAGFARNISANTTAARLAAWRQFDPTLIWYLGRDLPPATTRRDRLVRLYGKDQGQRIWQQWLYANDPALYIVGEKTDVAELSACGFEPEAPIEGNAVYMPLLFRRQQTPPGH